jgi:UDP-3-O-[3-hydroxymyristoyl] glucosamine N-acyltransferase
MKEIDLSQILSIIDDYKLIGNCQNIKVTNAKTITSADDKSIVWLKPNLKNSKELLQNTKAKIVICDKKTEENNYGKCIIKVENPKLTFTRILNHFFVRQPEWGIHSSAIIHKNAVIEKQVYIGPQSVIGAATVGKNTIIHGNCFIYDNVTIGSNVVIHAGTVIGADGFGYARNDSGRLELFPHIGGVIIEDNVEIGSNTSIDRGSLDNTIIKTGAKIDNLVHIAHNVIVGKHSAVIANAMIGGSVKISDYAWIAPSAAVMNQLQIGKGTTIGLGAVLTKNVPDNEVWTGSPARPLKQFIEMQNKIKKL